jgi:glycosidase
MAAFVVVRYLSNHDVNGSDGTPLDLFGGKKGSMAAFVVTACMKGVPMVYNGQEVGTPFRLVFPFTGRNIDWTLNPDMVAEYKRILLFRSTSSAMRHGQLSTYGDKDVVAFTKEVTEEKVLVVSNLRNKAINFSVPFPLQNTTWTDAMTGESITLTTQLDVQPYSYLIAKQ